MSRRDDWVARYWARVDCPPVLRWVPSPMCWLWTGGRNDRGYGHCWVHGKTYRAHRIMWIMLHGEPPAETPYVLHNCPGGDNPSCVSPHHLWLGTHEDNMLDMQRKGRKAVLSGDQHPAHIHPERLARGEQWHAAHDATLPRGEHGWAHLHPERVARGEQQGSAKLKAGDIPVICAAAASGESQSAIARRYGVSQSAIYLIVRGKNWRHVPEAVQ